MLYLMQNDKIFDVRYCSRTICAQDKTCWGYMVGGRSKMILCRKLKAKPHMIPHDYTACEMVIGNKGGLKEWNGQGDDPLAGVGPPPKMDTCIAPT